MHHARVPSVEEAALIDGRIQRRQRAYGQVSRAQEEPFRLHAAHSVAAMDPSLEPCMNVDAIMPALLNRATACCTDDRADDRLRDATSCNGGEVEAA